MSKPAVSGTVAREYCLKYPTTSTKKLAEMLCRDEAAIFLNYSQARCAIQYVRGIKANGHGDKVIPSRLVPKFDLPPAVPPEWKIITLPKAAKRWLVLSDVHIPFHDNAAIEAMLRFATRKGNRCDGVLMNGDIMDCYSLSKYLQDPRLRKPAEEVEATKLFLAAIRKHVKPLAGCFVWAEGNHEIRLSLYLMKRAPELFEIDPSKFSWPAILDLDKLGVTWKPTLHLMQCGKLGILHGHEWKGGISSPVNPARGAYLKARECVVVGHAHRTSEHTEPTVFGTVVTTWSVGCMCDLHPAYMPINNWNNGFAILDTRDGWKVENYRVVNGEVV